VPIQPTAHYAMGGIPTNLNTEVLADHTGRTIEGLFAAGEAACVSVHGANRLGTNSLVDLVVFGKHGGIKMAEYCKDAQFREIDRANAHKPGEAQLEAIRNSTGSERPAVLRRELQVMMDDLVGVVRTDEGLRQAIAKIEELQARFRNIRVDDKGMKWNTDLMETWELGCLLDLAEVTAHAALWRRESRGGHFREDFPSRDDVNYLNHSFVWKNGKVDVQSKPVTITRIQPQERKY
jgi:succinate dehydrogenase / fumarate reductase flavoprotein subunit